MQPSPRDYEINKSLDFVAEYRKLRELRTLYTKMISLSQNNDEKKLYEEKLENAQYKIETLKGFASTYQSIEIDNTQKDNAGKYTKNKTIDLTLLAIKVDEAREIIDKATNQNDKNVAHEKWIRAVIDLTEGEEAFSQTQEESKQV